MRTEELKRAIYNYTLWINESPEQYKQDCLERKERKAYFQSWTAYRLQSIDAEGLLELLHQLWALKSWGNKRYVIERLAEKTGLKKIGSSLADLIWGEGDLAKRWAAFERNVNGMGPAMMSELLCHVHPNEFMVWNRKAFNGFTNLGISDLPRYNYQMTGKRYIELCETAKEIAREIERAGLKNVDLLEVNYFIWGNLQDSPPISKVNYAEGSVRPLELTDDVAKGDKHGFIHNEVRDKLRDIGEWLGFDAETEIKVAQGSVVDTIWEATIGNMGRVIYVFEVQTKGSIDSLILNLLKSLNNSAVQGIVAVSDQKQLEKIRGHAEEVGDLAGRLKYWDYRQVLEIHEALASVNEAINDLDLVPQSLHAKRTP